MTGAMSVPAREAFLAEAHIAVISVAAEDDRAPLAVPMWYGYEPGGDITLITSRGSRKAALIRRGGRLSVCAQTTEPPRRYVSVEGEVVEIRESVTADERRALAETEPALEDAALLIVGIDRRHRRPQPFEWVH